MLNNIFLNLKKNLFYLAEGFELCWRDPQDFSALKDEEVSVAVVAVPGAAGCTVVELNVRTPDIVDAKVNSLET